MLFDLTRKNDLLTANDVSAKQKEERENPKNNQGFILVAHRRYYLDGHRGRRRDEVRADLVQLLDNECIIGEDSLGFFNDIYINLG